MAKKKLVLTITTVVDESEIDQSLLTDLINDCKAVVKDANKKNKVNDKKGVISTDASFEMLDFTE